MVLLALLYVFSKEGGWRWIDELAKMDGWVVGEVFKGNGTEDNGRRRARAFSCCVVWILSISLYASKM